MLDITRHARLHWNLVMANILYKCHVCLGSYNETAQHAKRQHNGADSESSRQQRRAGSRAGQQSKAARQRGREAGQGRGAGQQGKARQ